MDFYHLCNRGVDKRDIFLDDQDYLRFVHDLFEFNDEHATPSINTYNFVKSLDIGRPNMTMPRRKPRKLLVNLHCFALMPNHYHLLVSPLTENAIPLFMKKLNMGYAKYFNERYERSGALFQGKYRKVLVERDAHFLYLPYYIHFNPLDLALPEWRGKRLRSIKNAMDFLDAYRWSSHQDYLGMKNLPSLTQRDFLLQHFGGSDGYRASAKEMLGAMDSHLLPPEKFD